MSCFERIRAFSGEVGFYARSLGGGEALAHNPDLPLVAASVIKLPLLVAAFRDILRGDLDPAEMVEIRPEMKKPSYGALTYMHSGLQVTVMDLITLMIVLSDNTATNLLIDRLTIGHVNRTMGWLGIPGIALRR